MNTHLLDPSVPIEWAAGRIIERHRLPPHSRMLHHVIFYILTRDPACFAEQGPLDVRIMHGDVTSGRGASGDGDPEAFEIVIKGIDEFITKDDWMKVWDDNVKWRQDRLWHLQGQRPQGRHSVDIERLRESCLFSLKRFDNTRPQRSFLPVMHLIQQWPIC